MHAVQFRRKREGKTNYRKRLKMLLSGRLRLVIRKSLNNISAQIIEYHPGGDMVVACANSAELKKFGWKTNGGNIPSAYLVGLLIGKKAKEDGIKEAVVDIGLYCSTKNSRIYALVKGALDGGLSVPCSPDVLPDDERVKGKHIKENALLLMKNAEDYKKRFSDYIKKDINPAEFNKYFDDVKKKISGDKNA